MQASDNNLHPRSRLSTGDQRLSIVDRLRFEAARMGAALDRAKGGK